MDALELVKKFAGSVEAAIGEENTTIFLEAVTNFAQQCPETMQEIVTLVSENPTVFANLLTPAGVLEAKEMIEQVAMYAPLIGSFGK
ncbi:MAG: hypothetical protein ABIN80_28655 [Dyadobacter sp.]|uniref:hypothetical protein n=1 Tax=Dyadobacter sp. TaxID=1914288 RepID=UPI003265099B